MCTLPSPLTTTLPVTSQPSPLTTSPPQTSQTTQTSMARTKQTARKVTGGSAPGVNLQVLQKKKAKTKLASKKPSPKTPANTNSVNIFLYGVHPSDILHSSVSCVGMV
ncbi:hypothetical protein EDC04DRAFT_2601278 [Pisolithus marmoratus]|nr:hypothetical protein EDC04DRAFT_2601278 [Pisolithus marmoratus]